MHKLQDLLHSKPYGARFVLFHWRQSWQELGKLTFRKSYGGQNVASTRAKPHVRCARGALLSLCFTPMRHYLELMKEQDSQAPDVAFLEALYRLEDPRRK